MNKAMTINIILIISVLVLIGLLGYFLIINREDERFSRIFSKILIALFAAIILIGFEFLVPPKSVEKKIKVLTLRNKTHTKISEFSKRLLITNSDYRNGYEMMSLVESINYRYKFKNLESIGLDNLEYTFWVWLGRRYSMHWDIERDSFLGISGGGESASVRINADKETKVYEYQEIKDLLVSNQLLPDENGLFLRVHFPKNTILKVKKHSEYVREYLIKNKYYDFTIIMYSAGNSGLNVTNLGEAIKASLRASLNDINGEWYSDRLIVKMKCKFSAIRKGSPELKKQKEWIIDIMNGFEHDFEWDNLKPELEKAYGI